jgi:Ca-activated chloride channel family protein
MIINVQTDHPKVLAQAGRTAYTVASIVAPRGERMSTRGPVNVAFVLDRSGSMDGEKIELARLAVDHALGLLRSDDRFSLVAFDSEIDVIVPSTTATQDAREHARAKLALIGPRDQTDLCGGWLAGCEQVARFVECEGAGRCLLLTDGLANEGVIDHEEIVSQVRELRRRGVVTSTFGVGANFDERLLQQMADAGAGHFYFIERAKAIPEIVASELGEALEVVASGVTLTIDTPGGFPAQVLNEFETISEPGRLTVYLGDLVSGQELSVVTRFRLPNGKEGTCTAATFSLRSAGTSTPGPSVQQVWTFASRIAFNAQPRNQAVGEALGEINAARARAQALELNRNGDFAGARSVLTSVAASIEPYAAESPALQREIVVLYQTAQETSAPMNPLATKAMHFSAGAALRGRTLEGKARRGA